MQELPPVASPCRGVGQWQGPVPDIGIDPRAFGRLSVKVPRRLQASSVRSSSFSFCWLDLVKGGRTDGHTAREKILPLVITRVLTEQTVRVSSPPPLGVYRHPPPRARSYTMLGSTASPAPSNTHLCRRSEAGPALTDTSLFLRCWHLRALLAVTSTPSSRAGAQRNPTVETTVKMGKKNKSKKQEDDDWYVRPIPPVVPSIYSASNNPSLVPFAIPPSHCGIASCP